MRKISKNKLSLPMISGLTLALVDLIFWAWFAVYALSISRVDILAEGLWGMMVLHFPSSMALPIIGSTILPFLDGAIGMFRSTDLPLPQFLILATAGITQYFLVGYLIGWIISFFNKELGKHKDNKQPGAGREVAVAGKIKKTKIVFINFTYLIFSLPILLIINEYLHDIFTDFARFKMMHLVSNILMNLAVILLWGVSSFYEYKFNKKTFKEDKWNLIYVLIPLSVILITWTFIN